MYIPYIYMESRKMVLMSLLAGQQWRRGQREQTVGTVVVGGKERADEWLEWPRNISTTVCKTEPVGIGCVTQGTQAGAL